MTRASLTRIIPRLDVKGAHLVKGIHLEGLRVLGSPEAFARLYAEAGADELLYIDVVASLYGRNSLLDLVSRTSSEVFVPLTGGRPVGGTGETVHLHATDADSEWLLTLHAERVDATRGHAKGDAALRGAARDLLLSVWGRDPLGAVEHLGDETVIATFTAAARI